jgi:hypothetical protein
MAQKHTPDLFDFPHWQREYEALISETDEARLPELATALEHALFERMQILGNKHGTIEEKAIQAAIKTLRRVQEEKLNFPTWGNGAC